jgi:hypothetical protein
MTQKSSKKTRTRYTCDLCGEIYYYADEAVEHIQGDHPEIDNQSSEEYLDYFRKTTAYF